MNMNKEDNDRMFAKLTKQQITAHDLAAHYENIRLKKKIDDGAFIALIIAIVFITGMGCVAIGVDTYLKMKNNGQRNTNSIEFNLRK